LSGGICFVRHPSERDEVKPEKIFLAHDGGIHCLCMQHQGREPPFYPDTQQYKYWLVLLPFVPIIYQTITIIRAVSAMDEMKRKIVTEAMAFAGLATGFTCFTYLFLRDMGAPEFRPEWAFYLMWAYYFIGLFFSWRRYA
jgi:hypothetical protein